MELKTPYRARVDRDECEAVDESSMMLSVRTMVEDNMQAGVAYAQIRMVQVYYNDTFSPTLTRKAWEEAKRILRVSSG